MSVVRGIRIVDFDSWSSHWWNFDFHRAHHRMMAVDTPCSACGPLAIGSGDNRDRSTGFPLDHQACNVSRSMPARVLFQGVWLDEARSFQGSQQPVNHHLHRDSPPYSNFVFVLDDRMYTAADP